MTAFLLVIALFFPETALIGTNKFKIGIVAVRKHFPVACGDIAHYLCRGACSDLSGRDTGLLSDQ